MNWTRIASTADLKDDEGLGVAVGEKRIALFRDSGEVFATDDVCTHAFALLSEGFLEDGCIECPLHQARFDIRTGKALCAPATEDIRTYPVRIDGDGVWIAT
jgi:3-phenylpropionate/trans-cinnamate dioxygenase ferredoxin subunit